MGRYGSQSQSPIGESMMHIPLTKGQYTIVDDEDYPLLSRHNWYYEPAGSTGYAVSKSLTLGKMYMHRLILPPGRVYNLIDHIDGNGLDNRKVNLRLANSRQNIQNSTKARKSNSQYKGVFWDKEKQKWGSHITTEPYKATDLGRFEEEHIAALMYDFWAVDVYGEFAKTNFNVVAHGP
jgi:hypothetical protein